MTLPSLRLNKNADRRLKAGHIWIYSNEIDNKVTPLTALQPGDQAVIENNTGKALGIASINPQTLICGRLISRDIRKPLDVSLLVHRIKIALGLRQQCFDKPFYRLVFGDSDLLPGLVVDRFGDYLVVQIATAGMEALKDEIVAALVKVLKPIGVLLRNDGNMRQLESLPEYVEVAYGDVPEVVELEENGVKFLAPLHTGQKTGWFYDHRPGRQRLQHYSKGKRVLDVFSYIGGWGVQAAAAGASEVICLDSSGQALDMAEQSADLNGVRDNFQTMEGDAFEGLRQLRDAGEQFDVVVVDPPAFIKRKKDIAKGEQAYRRINELAMRLLGREGLLVSASCSMHLQRDRLVDLLRAGSRHLDRNLQVFEQTHQGADHPIHPAIPETEYIKSLFARVYMQ
ncbi:class I SAM-dependent rRNA methyltransferase [Endozoicomonadaceae bacterium StTr2]